MRSFGDDKRNQRQAHADENQFTVTNLASGSADHEFGKSVLPARTCIGNRSYHSKAIRLTFAGAFQTQNVKAKRRHEPVLPIRLPDMAGTTTSQYPFETPRLAEKLF